MKVQTRVQKTVNDDENEKNLSKDHVFRNSYTIF